MVNASKATTNLTKYQRDSKRPFCWVCGRQLKYVEGEPVYQIMVVDGHSLKVHKDCKKREAEQR